MEKKHKHFKIETVQEIWRGEDLTFNVFYTTEKICYIKAMRGKFNKKDRQAITDYISSQGYDAVWYERERGDEKIMYEVKLKDETS